MLVYFVRHGESASNAAPGGMALPLDQGDRLTERGFEQARAVAQRLAAAGATRILASPLRRARETAEVIADRLELPITEVEELRELRESEGFGELPLEDQRLRRWSVWMTEHPDQPDFSPPGGESFAAMLDRVERVKALLLEHRDQRVLAVSHGILLRFLFLHSLLERDFGPIQVPRMWQLRTVNCGLSAFQHRRHGEETAYPSPGEWLCLTWMARPWDPPLGRP